VEARRPQNAHQETLAMLTLVPDAIEQYAAAHTDPAPALHDELQQETRDKTTLPQMQVGVLEGRLLRLLTQLTNAKLAVEVGTFTGCSALHIAEGLAEGGRLITCDIDPEATAIAQKYWKKAGVADKVELRLGPAIETLASIDGPIDLAFIDADKEGYISYWDALVPKVRQGGLIVVDNVLWSGKVLDPQSESDRAIVAFNSHAMADDRVEKVMLTVRDGVLVARKL
jgi:caffeoyl-CoA O-methyltransferase